VRFIYLNGSKNGKIFFYVDSENLDSPDYSPPGQQYEEASQLVRELFVKKPADLKLQVIGGNLGFCHGADCRSCYG